MLATRYSLSTSPRRTRATTTRGARVSGTSIGLAFGIACFVGILVWHGLREVAAALATAGAGLLVVAAYHVVPLCLDALGWRALHARSERPSVLLAVRTRWVGEAVNSLLPVMQIGGAVARARLLARAGMDALTAAASIVVDVTMLFATQVVFTLLGLAVLLVNRLGDGDLGLAAALGTALMAGAVAALVIVQRRGLFGGLAGTIERLFGREGGTFAVRAAEIDTRVREFHRARGRLVASGIYHLASWILGTGETWLALRFLGHPVDLLGALLLESLGQAVRAAAFAVPGGLGVQEGGYLLLGRTLGVPPETAIALSLAKRVRELCWGLPGLVLWQVGSVAFLRGHLGTRETQGA